MFRRDADNSTDFLIREIFKPQEHDSPVEGLKATYSSLSI